MVKLNHIDNNDGNAQCLLINHTVFLLDTRLVKFHFKIIFNFLFLINLFFYNYRHLHAYTTHTHTFTNT